MTRPGFGSKGDFSASGAIGGKCGKNARLLSKNATEFHCGNSGASL
ncbi:hypothetical protein CLOSTHATH_01980 [Hungatella hathewayi DSM 13479]|uniref:Uncharacterized protein n=1 Tax=Hungatella hathewayi DSM 13479 TaxID=566550 RepID=D3AEE9_9FIRM|nr:hypothetical protein CLOSTHATH_01980 [Hungatella hathewayi DSM 13479]